MRSSSLHREHESLSCGMSDDERARAAAPLFGLGGGAGAGIGGGGDGIDRLTCAEVRAQ